MIFRATGCLELDVCVSRLHGACFTIANLAFTDDALTLSLRLVMPAAFPKQACAGNETSGNGNRINVSVRAQAGLQTGPPKGDAW